jgi:Fur family ferric uptake transcriptional regulator
LRKKGLRFTPEREHVLEAAVSYSDHFDAEDLHLSIRNRHGRVSKASVYRTLPLLLQCGIIRTVGHHDGRYQYEYIYGHAHHCHLRCVRCGKVVEFTVEHLNEMGNKVGREHGFQITGHRLELYGYCRDCLRSVARKEAAP